MGCDDGARRLSAGCEEGFDSAFEVLAGDDVHDLDGVGLEAEEHSVVDADADAEDFWQDFEADDLGEGVGLSAGDAA